MVVVLLAAGVLVASCTGNSQPSARLAPPTAARAGSAQAGSAQAGAVTSDGCAGQPPVSPLPTWARAGFSPADQAMPHVLGEAGNIVAILWASRDALHSPPLQDRNNKILWVSRIPLTWLLGTAPELVRPHRRAQAALRGLGHARRRPWQGWGAFGR